MAEDAVDEDLKPLIGVDPLGYGVKGLDVAGTDIAGLPSRSAMESFK